MTIKNQILILEAVDPKPLPSWLDNNNLTMQITFDCDSPCAYRNFRVTDILEEHYATDKFDEWNW